MTSVIVIIGPTGSGKSIQSENLIKRNKEWIHISSGDLLREDPVFAKDIENGRLLDSINVEKIVGDALNKSIKSPIVLLDGFPRIIEQAEWLDSFLTSINTAIKLIINITISKDIAENRLMKRGRTDDTRASIDVKWSDYTSRTTPLLVYYKQHNISVLTVDGNLALDDMSKIIESNIYV